VAQLDLKDVQGLILRGYKMMALRQFILRVDNVEEGKAFVGRLVGGGSDGTPQITTETNWTHPPHYCLNISFSFRGLGAMGLSEDSLNSFPDEFKEGAAARATVVGDTGEMAPEHWIGELNSPDAHVLLTLFAQSKEIIGEVSGTLREGFARGGAFKELSCQDGGMLEGFVAHFGYRDGFAQPTIAGAPATGLTDPQPQAKLGAFLFGYPSQWDRFSYPVPTPNELGHNGSFLAYRILEQDCHGFETFLEDSAAELGVDKELIAAKLCGRWRNGIPLALSPETDQPETPILEKDWNNFDYAQSETWNGFDDRKGVRCPIGSHIRRANPRGSKIAGNGNLRRIVRRGLPYGPPYDPANPTDGVERGLLGIFINVSLKDQFEFIMKDWINNGVFAPGLGAGHDPVLGHQDPQSSKFSIPIEQGPPRVLKGFSSFIKTRGGMYCFIPSITALRFISGSG
jgi:deferrochelatase/peroxidase EfeB